MLGVFTAIFSTLFAAPQAAPRPASAAVVAGVVQDQTTAVLPNAQVELRLAGSAAPLQTVASDATGHFRFERVLPGANARPDAVGWNSLEGPGFGNLSSPFFSQAISPQPPRRIQFSMRVRY